MARTRKCAECGLDEEMRCLALNPSCGHCILKDWRRIKDVGAFYTELYGGVKIRVLHWLIDFSSHVSNCEPIHFNWIEYIHILKMLFGYYRILRVHEKILLSDTYRRLIGDPLETDISDQRPIGDQHARLETDMPRWRPTLPHRRPTCPIRDRNVSSETHWSSMLVFYMSAIWHVDYWSCMSISDGTCRSRMGLRLCGSVSDRSLIITIFSWSRILTWMLLVYRIQVMQQGYLFFKQSFVYYSPRKKGF